jgi:hypothetical protein
MIWKWPFKRDEIISALQNRSGTQVEIGNFRKTYFPPGAIATDVRFVNPAHRDQPLLTLSSMVIRGTYTRMLMVSSEIAEVELTGFHLVVPPRGSDGTSGKIFPARGGSGKAITIGKLQANGAVLEFQSSQPGEKPVRLDVRQLTLDHAGEKSPMGYTVWLKTSVPPGEVHSSGKFGPWNPDNPGATALAGSYTFDRAKLSVFEGISGFLGSQGRFHGTLGKINCEGNVDVPMFHVTSSSHNVHLSAGFKAVVDGTNGDTSLRDVAAHFGNTTIRGVADIRGRSGQNGKTLTLDATSNEGRVDDLLRLFTSRSEAAMKGTVGMKVKVKLPPEPPGFLTRLQLEGDFGVAGGRFTNPNTQTPINHLSGSARGESKKEEERADAPTVLSNLRGHVSALNGTATLSKVSFDVPGANASVNGTFRLVDQKLNLEGLLHTTGKLSDTTGGFKALLVKAVTPFYKKKNAVRIVPFKITGTAGQPNFALEVNRKGS